MTRHADRDWIDAAVARYEGPLLRYARRLLGDAGRAADVVQDTFLRLCGQRRADLEDHLAEWLYTVCRNRALDVGRKEARMTTADEAGLLRLPASEAGPEADAQRGETTGRVLARLARLPESQQEVLRLRFQGGLSYKEIARVTSRSVNHVGVLIHHGIKTLRAELGARPRDAARRQP